MPVVDTLRFGFRLPRVATDQGGNSAPAITQPRAVSPVLRPDLPPMRSTTIRSVEPTSLSIDRTRRLARFDLRFRLADGVTRRVPARCMWATGSPGGERTALMACAIRLALTGGNILELVVTPPDNDRGFIVRETLRALRAAEDFQSRRIGR